MQRILMAVGRVLLGLYFLLPGLAKFGAWERHITLKEYKVTRKKTAETRKHHAQP